MKWIQKAWHQDGTPINPEELQKLNLELQEEEDERWRARQREDPKANEELTRQLGL